MAIDQQLPPPETMLARRQTRIAALATIAAAAVVAAGAVAILLASWSRLNAGLVAYLILWVLLQVVVTAMAVAMLRGLVWAQRLLLVYHLLLASLAILAGGYTMLLGVPQWYSGLIAAGMALPDIALVVSAAAVIGIAGAIVLVSASKTVSRLRYGSVVAVTTAAALTLAVVVNLIVQVDAPWSVNVESSGQYALSPRLKRILQGLDQRVTITCAYTATDPDKQRIAAEYGTRTYELLKTVADASDRVEVVDASTDTQKAKVIMRLSSALDDQYDKHIKFLDQFLAEGKGIDEQLGTAARAWGALDQDSYLNNWSRIVFYQLLLTQQARKNEETLATVRREKSAAGLPDYANLTATARTALTGTEMTLQAVTQELVTLGAIAPEVARARPELLAKAARAVENAQAMVRALGTEEKPVPVDPAGDLGRFITAARETARTTAEIARAIEAMAGPENAAILSRARPLHVRVAAEPDPQGRPQESRELLSERYRTVATLLQQTAARTEKVLASFTTARQAEEVVNMRKGLLSVAVMLQQMRDLLDTATQRLATVDDPTAALITAARNKTLYPELSRTLQALARQAKDLPPVEPTSLPADLQKDNIVIIETDAHAEVIPFDTMWPQRFRDPWATTETQQDVPRFFNGNAAIGSKLLTMTQPPFAQVLLAYRTVPATRFMPSAGVGPDQVTTLTSRLEKANFRVKTWNLDHPRPKAAAGDPALQVLIVLPPPPITSGGLRPRNVERIRQAVDDGIAAIFLTSSEQLLAPPGDHGPTYALNEYLLKDWGIEALSDLFIVPAVPDPKSTDRFRISPQRLIYTPISYFSDHPITAGLQGRQTLWQWLCPLRHDANVAGVSVEPLVSIPPTRSVWATPAIEKLQAQFRSTAENQVWPLYDAGDKPSPFALAFAATRSAPTTQAASAPTQPSAHPARIVVMSMAMGLMDGYLDAPVQSFDARGTIATEDPPSANAEIVLNSACWLIGKESYIAAGPGNMPYVAIDPGTRTLLAALFVLVVPAAVLSVGIIIMAMRKW